jgi:hypothetical protein
MQIVFMIVDGVLSPPTTTVYFYCKRNGKDVNRCPVKANTALAIAPATGPMGGSPIPPGSSPPPTITTLMSGA